MPSIDLLREQTQLLWDGVRVSLNPNEVRLSVVRGDSGCTLSVAFCGMTVAVALVDEAAAHLAGLLVQPSSSQQEAA